LPAPIYLTGFEHGLASLNGSGLFDNAITNASVQSTITRSGGFAARVNSAAAVGTAGLLTVTTTATWVYRVAFRFGTLPTANVAVFTIFSPTNANCSLGFNNATSKICFFDGDASTVLAGSDWNLGVVQTGVWYVVDVKVNASNVSWNAKLDSAANWSAQPNVTDGVWVTWTRPECGNSSLSQTLDCYYDDVLISNTLADWPLGDGRVTPVFPASDASGSSVAANQFFNGDTAGSALTNTPGTAYTLVDDAPAWVTARSTTDDVRQATTGSGNFYAFGVSQTKTETRPANAVRALLAYSNAAGGVATAGCAARNSAGTQVAIWGDGTTAQSYAATTNQFKGAIVTVPAAGWSTAEIDAVTFRIGYATAVTDPPTWQALMLEVDFPAAAVPIKPPSVPVVYMRRNL
jgi:hypothetical protein